jgi:hypothetical protein
MKDGKATNVIVTNCRFGAVLEEFEVRDALSNLFIAKENMSLGQVSLPQQIEAY